MNSTERFATSFATKYGIDVTMVIMLIEAIVSIFQNCPQSRSTLRGTVRSPGLFQRARATQVVMQNLTGVSRARARQIATDLLAEAAATDEATLDAVIEECCNPGTW